ncbi:MAG TPA: tetratricopeptide repeat protein, partial [Ktedonobacteraceae bacterium]|nr:tetratricopeptide repeat protein [Ktedonobacteraceae bacterium]
DTIEQILEEVSKRLLHISYFYDVLLTLQPLDYQIHQEAFSHAHHLVSDPERTIVYLDLMVQRFPDMRASHLRQLSLTLFDLAQQYDPQKMPERVQHLLQRADETVRQSIVIDDDAVSHVIYGELFTYKGELEKAEAEFSIALEKKPGGKIETFIEVGLASIAAQCGQIREALAHYKRVTESDPQFPGIWSKLGQAHRLLGELEDAKQCYQQAIKINPHDVRAYHEFAGIYTRANQLDEAYPILEEAIQLNPESALLHGMLASVYLQQGDRDAAERELEEAERLDPQLELVQALLPLLRSSKRK